MEQWFPDNSQVLKSITVLTEQKWERMWWGFFMLGARLVGFRWTARFLNRDSHQALDPGVRDRTTAKELLILEEMDEAVRLRGLQPTKTLCPWDSPGKNTAVGCHFLFQGILLTQGLKLHLWCLLHYRQILFHCAT